MPTTATSYLQLSPSDMRMLWVAIVAIAAFDCFYAFAHRHTFDQWEVNGLALFFYGQVGLAAILFFKAFWLSIVLLGLPRIRASLARRATWLLATVHFGLLAQYVRVFLLT